MGNTAITWAAGNGHIDCLKLLVDSGGDINGRDIVSDMFVIILSVTPLPVYLYLLNYFTSGFILNLKMKLTIAEWWSDVNHAEVIIRISNVKTES